MTVGPGAVARDAAAGEIPAELRRDVRLLGDALGQVLTESGGADLLADVERLRQAVIAARAGGDPDEPVRVASAYDDERAEDVARAFTAYFQLVNLAEERQRVRALRARPADDPRPDSFAGVATRLDAASLDEALAGLRVHPVLTAHPTEARRRAVQAAVRRIGAQLDRFDDPRLGPLEVADARRRLLEEITTLWRTAQLRRVRPGPLDEVRAAMAVFDDTLFTMVPAVYREFELALSGEAAGASPPRVPAYLRYGSWIGGDRDGNPHVTATITRQAMEIQADHVLRALATAATRIGRTLTLDAGTTPPDDRLRAALQRAADAHPDLLAELATTSPGEPHRQWLLHAAARITATRTRDADLAYRSADELLADLRLLQDSLAQAGALRSAYGEVQHLLWQVETFGFHLAGLEVRQHSDVHRSALAALGVAYEVGALDVAACAADVRETDDPTATEVLATLRTMAALQDRWGVEACRRHVVSFTRSAADLVAVRALARLAVGARPLVIDVVPLFETQDDLRHAVDVLDEWLPLPSTQTWLDSTGGRVEVMLGYSDSAKDVGPVSATLSLYDAQGALAGWADRHGLALTLFHGRGGALGRGGGPAGRAVLSSAPRSVAGRFKVTEQGEVISARYGHAPIGVRHVEQVTSAVLLASTADVERRTADAAARFSGLARRIGDAARSAYRSLVETEGFADYVARVSPLEELGELQIGSRPSRRRTGGGLETLRAIPWVFAWTQTRANLPGWYGLGTGFEAAAADGIAELQAAYAEWPLFESMIDNVEMSLAKADRAIAQRYLALGARPDLTAQILEEYDRTVRMVFAVTGHDRLLARRRVLSRAVDLRNPYVDALSHLQLRALSALRADPDGAAAEPARRLLLLTLGGVSAGLQNTG
ncbi:MAG TPA: phosphoenolpyruvate carboxylase [Mycobacteriales bacterium]|nr:phosphoenolpyruvate carboxylase [Mycobacteriales bacterium]